MCTTTNLSKMDTSAQLSPTAIASASESGGSPAACFWPESMVGPSAFGFAPELIMSLMMTGSGAHLPFGLPPFAALPPLCAIGGSNALPSIASNAATDYFMQQRFKAQQEEPKPNHSYIGLIAMAILSSSDKKLLLSEIYDWILKNYTYFRNKGPGWRNSVRHNLSLNDCFVKVGRAANGKGHYWSIHPANMEDFQRGDFRRRKAQRKVRKHMGLSCPDDEDSSRSPSPAKSASPKPKPSSSSTAASSTAAIDSRSVAMLVDNNANRPGHSGDIDKAGILDSLTTARVNVGRKRAFDVESLLQPDKMASHSLPMMMRAAASVSQNRMSSTSNSNSNSSANSHNYSSINGGSEQSQSQSHSQSQLAQQYFATLNAFCTQQSNYLAAMAHCGSLSDSIIN